MDMLPAIDADWTMMAGGFVSDPSTTAGGCRDSRSLVEAFVSSITPSVRAMIYDVTSYMNPKIRGGGEPGAHGYKSVNETKARWGMGNKISVLRLT